MPCLDTVIEPQEVWYLGGRVRADQPRQGYRAGLDAVLLARSITPQSGQSILEMGSGSGLILLALAQACTVKSTKIQLLGWDRSASMIELSRHNQQFLPDSAGVDLCFEQQNIETAPKHMHLSFDQILSNPPFFDDADAVRMSDAKAPSFVARGAGLQTWCETMLKLLRPRGIGTIIYRADQIDHLLRALGPQVGAVQILPIAPFADAPANRVIIQFRKGVKTAAKVWPSLILHERGSEQKYTQTAAQILDGERHLFVVGEAKR